MLQNTQYGRRKLILRRELQDFLTHLHAPRKINLQQTTPEDIRFFLIWKDTKGKTVVHTQECIGIQGNQNVCQCPTRLAAGSVDSIIGQLRAILRDSGRGDKWDENYGIGNPVASPLIKNYLKAIKLEQSRALVKPKQAKPLFLDKLEKLARALNYWSASPTLSTVQKVLLLRDRAYFLLLGYTGDRGSDLGQISSNQIWWLHEKQGIRLEISLGKTTLGARPREVDVMRGHNKGVCPIEALLTYVSQAESLGMPVTPGYIFRKKDPKQDRLMNSPVCANSMTPRLKRHLQAINLFEGEAAHSSRAGSAITLKLLGVPDDHAMHHVGWRSNAMHSRYLQGVDGATPSQDLGAAYMLATTSKTCLPKGPSKNLKQVFM